MKVRIILFVIMSAAAVTMDAEPADSLRDGHRELKELEVVGVKQMPVAELAATTRIGAGMVRRYGITGLKDVSEMAPNFYMPDYGSRMTSSIYVRGLGARMDQPIIGLTVDNVPILNKDAYDFDVADIESIETQGNTLAGAPSVPFFLFSLITPHSSM